MDFCITDMCSLIYIYMPLPIILLCLYVKMSISKTLSNLIDYIDNVESDNRVDIHLFIYLFIYYILNCSHYIRKTNEIRLIWLLLWFFELYYWCKIWNKNMKHYDEEKKNAKADYNSDNVSI